MSDQQGSRSARQQKPLFKQCYATVLRAVDTQYDIRGYQLSHLVTLCLSNRAKVPLEKRAYYERYVQLEALAYLEHLTAQLLFGPDGRLSPHEYRYVAGLSSEGGGLNLDSD